MSSIDDFDALLGPPASPAQRRRQQASQARFDHALGLIEQAAKAASAGDWLGGVNRQPRDRLLREGAQALVWLRAFTW